jgi:hypothetical protein
VASGEVKIEIIIIFGPSSILCSADRLSCVVRLLASYEPGLPG